MRRLLLLLPWTRAARSDRSYRPAVDDLRQWQQTERERMATYDDAVRRIVTDDGGRSWR